MKIIGVIPARYKSSRFPGKPLADIAGKPMIYWVYQQCKKVDDFDEVYVATDDELIFKTCIDLGVEVILTSDTHRTATDRIGEVARKIPAVFGTIETEPIMSFVFKIGTSDDDTTGSL